MAIAMAIITVAQSATQTGFQSALIQKQENIEDLLNTTWSFEFLRCIVLALIIFASAPLLSAFINEPRVVDIIRVLSITLAIQGSGNIGVVYFRKNLDFQKQSFFDIIPLVINILIVIPLVLLLKNVWALVCATLLTAIVTGIISYIIHPYRPRIDLNFKKFKELLNFGKWIFGQGIIVMFLDQAVTIFIGKFHGIFNLGFYNRANVFSTMIFQQLSDVVWKVGYPVYSQLQMEPIKFKKAYLQTLQLLTFIVFPMAAGLFVLSHEFVHLLLTDKWLPIVPLIQILCLQAILTCINTPPAIVFQSSGNPGVGTKITAVSVLLLALLIYPLSNGWGVPGIVTAVFISILITSPIMWHMANKFAKCSFLEFLKPIVFALLNSFIMFLSIVLVKHFFCKSIYIFEFMLLMSTGITIYITSAYYLDKLMKLGMYKLVKERVFSFR
jgi:lipopolysaccharide exporter